MRLPTCARRGARTALSLLPLHAALSILSESLVRLLNAALGAKRTPRAALVSGGPGCPSVPAMVAQNLSVTPPLGRRGAHALSRLPARLGFPPLPRSRSCAASDKQAAEKLRPCRAGSLSPGERCLICAPSCRVLPSGNTAPPAREGARSIGEDSEMARAEARSRIECELFGGLREVEQR